MAARGRGLAAGAVGGLLGGALFALVTRSDSIARWLGVLAVGLLLGILFELAFGRWASRSLWTAIGFGLLWGALAWALICYLALGQRGDTAMTSLGGAIAAGAVLGIAYGIGRRSPAGGSLEGPTDIVHPGSAQIDPSQELPPPDRRI